MGLTSFTYQLKSKTKQIFFSQYKICKLFKPILNNTEPKKLVSSVVSDNKTRFKTWLNPPIQLEKKRY